jgi:hypothetical protein
MRYSRLVFLSVLALVFSTFLVPLVSPQALQVSLAATQYTIQAWQSTAPSSVAPGAVNNTGQLARGAQSTCN